MRNVQIASVERAICDQIYLDGEIFFDNLRNINWEYMEQINSQVFYNDNKIALFIDKNVDASIKNK